MREGALWRLDHIMAGTKFEKVTANIRFINNKIPPYADKFHKVQTMIIDFNQHTREAFVASCISCLDESMSI